jgi:hypothetical protein
MPQQYEFTFQLYDGRRSARVASFMSLLLHSCVSSMTVEVPMKLALPQATGSALLSARLLPAQRF